MASKAEQGMSGKAKTTALTALATGNVCACKDVLARCAVCCACAGVCRHMDVATWSCKVVAMGYDSGPR